MKKSLLLLLCLGLIGCATYTKSIQLSPQKTDGWKKGGPHTYQYECSQGEVKVGPIVLGYESKGDFNFFIPIPDSKEEVRKANEEDAWLFVQFRDVKPIGSCDLSYVFLMNQNSGNKLSPKNSMDIPINGMYKGKYTHICHYYFDLDENSEGDYMLHISEKVFNGRIQPVPYKKEKSFEFYATDLL
jgi:hypothetical protein